MRVDDKVKVLRQHTGDPLVVEGLNLRTKNTGKPGGEMLDLVHRRCDFLKLQLCCDNTACCPIIVVNVLLCFLQGG